MMKDMITTMMITETKKKMMTITNVIVLAMAQLVEVFHLPNKLITRQDI